MRREFPMAGPEALPYATAYPLLTSSVVPRPIAWVSTRSLEGVDNLAPHSFFNVVGTRPPVLGFTSVGEKDTLRNLRVHQDYVIHIASADLFDAENHTSIDAPSDQSEFDLAHLTREPAKAVDASRVAEAPIALECRVRELISLGTDTLVLGDLLLVAVSEEVLADDGLPDIDKLRPLSRLGRIEWGLLGEIRRAGRPRWDRDPRSL
ncbi:flavin reductase family protein [Actinomycetota bacterium]